MAKIHKSKDHLGADMRRIRRRYVLGWIGRILAGLLLVAAYVLLWKQLRAWGDQLAGLYHGWAVTPLQTATPVATQGAYQPLQSPWLVGLHSAWEMVVCGAEMAVRLSPMLLPAFVAGVAMWIFGLMMAPMHSDAFQGLRAGVEGERYALSLVRGMSRSCHVFVNKYIPYDGHWSETDLILVGPGGVAIVEVKNWSGLVQGDAADEQVTREDGRTHYNPVRQVNTHVYRLKNYLRSKGVNAWVVPVVAFVHPKSKPDISGVTKAYTQDARSTVVVTAQQFHTNVALAMEGGTALSKAEIREVVRAIRSAPGKPAGA